MQPRRSAADGKSVEVWVGTQNPSGLISAIAKVLETDSKKVTLHQQYLGGGYGRRGNHEGPLDAVMLSKAIGKPVKLIWSREDDVAFGKFRPATVHHIEAGLDVAGKVIAWHHRIIAESVSAYNSGDRRRGWTAL